MEISARLLLRKKALIKTEIMVEVDAIIGLGEVAEDRDGGIGGSLNHYSDPIDDFSRHGQKTGGLYMGLDQDCSRRYRITIISSGDFQGQKDLYCRRPMGTHYLRLSTSTHLASSSQWS